MSESPRWRTAGTLAEIGQFHFCKALHPENTTMIWTGVKPFAPEVSTRSLTWRGLPRMWRELFNGRQDVIIVYVEQWAPWHWKNLRRIFGFHPIATSLRLVFIQMLRFAKPRCPLIVIDLTEWGIIHRYNEFLLDKCTIYFKRELPADRWRVFRRSSGGGYPGTRFRRSPRNRRRIEKLRPLALGCFGSFESDLAFPEKRSDIFIAVTTDNSSTIRTEGLAQISALRNHGIAVDIAESRLERQEFFERMSRAWLTWSPHGFGWDCLRHYEAPLAFSVPVISAPTIVRQFPLIHGEHCFYYFPDEPDSLGTTIRKALADKDRLREMAKAARSLVISHHIWPRRIDALIAMALGREPAPGGIVLDKTP